MVILVKYLSCWNNVLLVIPLGEWENRGFFVWRKDFVLKAVGNRILIVSQKVSPHHIFHILKLLKRFLGEGQISNILTAAISLSVS